MFGHELTAPGVQPTDQHQFEKVAPVAYQLFPVRNAVNAAELVGNDNEPSASSFRFDEAAARRLTVGSDKYPHTADGSSPVSTAKKDPAEQAAEYVAMSAHPKPSQYTGGKSLR